MEEPRHKDAISSSELASGTDEKVSLTDIIADFGSRTTTHGISDIVSATNRFGRLTWIIIVGAAFAALFLQVTLLVIQYFEYHVNVQVSELHQMSKTGLSVMKDKIN